MAFVSYDSYKNRIEKLAKFKNFVVKYKFLIMGVLAVIIGGVSALMATKGMITEDIVLADTFTYGQSYAPTAASAFLSGVEYEYSLQGSDEWTDKKPVKVGKYSVRAVTDKVIGNGYGKTLNFEILPAEITFTFNNNGEASLTYGSDPSKSDYSYSGLVPAYGDSVRGVVFDYDYPEAVGEDVGVTLKKLDIRAGDEDRSECYVYKTPSTKYKFAAKSVSFKLADASETYDGKAFAISGKPDSYTQNLLVNGDKFVMNTKITDGSGAAVAPVNAGSYRIEPDGAIKVVDGSGKDVTYRYDVSSPVNGTFTVNRRPVTLLSETEEWIYDGLTHSNDKYKITSGSLADGQSIIATSTVSVTDVSDGTQYNALSYEIYGNGTPVTDNYALTKNYGTLKVKACPLSITTAGDEWEYDGAAHPVTSYTAEGLVSGQTLTGLSFYSETAINVSDSGKNTLSYGIVWGQSGEEVNLSNYNITSSYGDIKITARPLKVETGSDTRAYNGEYLSCKSFTVTYAGDKVGQTNAFINDGEDLSIVGSLPKIINVGKKENAIGFAVPNGNYYLDETKTQNGVLEIIPAEITVTLSDVSCDYGDKLPAPAYTLQVSGKYGAGLFGGDTFTPAFLYDGAQSTRLNIGTHGITLDKANCAFGYGNSETVTEANYEIINSPTATLTVGSRTVTVTLNDTEVTYGNEIKYAGDYKSADGLVSGQTLTVSADKVTFGISSTMPDADVYYDVIACPTSAISVSENGADVTQNYVITVVSATLTVTQREITVKANDMTGIIYGEKIEYEVAEGNYANTPDLVSGEKLTIENVIKNFYDGVTPAVGEYTLTPDVNRITIVKEDGNSSRGNYKITSENGRLEIVKRPVKIQSATNLGFIYDGTAQYDKGFEILLDVAGYYGVLPEHSVDVTAWRLVTDVGEAVPNNNVYAIKDQSGKPVTGNYDITHVYGELKVNKRAITVELLTYSATYGDSYAYKTGAGNYANVPDLASGETLEITAVSYEFGSVTRPDASETPYLVSPVDYKILKADGSDSKANYTVNGVVGSVTIEKRAITVELLTYSATYGDSYAYKTGAGNYANVPDLASGETLEITAVSYEFGTVDYPDVRDTAYGVYLETYKILKTDGTGNNNNYTVTAVDGALTVTRRAITVTLNDIADTAYGEEVAYAGGYKSATNVLSGHTVTVNAVADDMTFSPAATYPDAGKYTFSCDGGFISVSTEDADVTGNYSVTVTAGNLEITKREITVTLLSYSREYGEDYSYPKGAGNFANTPDLAEGETLEVTTVSYDFTGSYPTVGSYAISTPASLKILKADGINGSDANYSVKLEKGELTVTQKTITVQFETVSMYYGEDDYRKQSYSELYSTEIGAVELPYNHALTLSFSFTDADGNAVTPKAVGEYNAIILNGETDNYVIVPEGTPVLQIERRLLHPDPYSKTEVYGATEFEYQSGKSNCDMRHEDMYFCLPAYGEEIELFVSYDLSGQSMPAVGLYNAICTGVRLHYPDGSYTDVAHINGDFEIGGYHVYFNNDESQLKGKLEITPREIKVTLNDIPDAVYGDTIVYTAGGETATNIVEGQTLTVDPDGVSFESENGSIYPNVGEYAVKGSKEFIKIFSGETEVTSNYKVTQIINGTLTINARKITVSLSPVANITYGDDLPVPEYTTAGYGDLTEGLVNGDEIKPTYVYKKAADDTVPEHYDAGNYKIYLDGYEFVYANGAPATIQNYEVIGEISPADLEITKRKITVTLKDFTRVYGQNNDDFLFWDTDEHTSQGAVCDMDINDLIEIDGLVQGERVQYLPLFVYETGTYTYVHCKNVGTYDVELSSWSLDYGDGEYFGASRNYEWDAPARATLEITKKAVVAELGEIKVTYGDKDNALSDYTVRIIGGEIPFGESIKITDFALVGWQDYPYGLDFDYRLDVGSYRIDPYYNYDKNGFTVYDEDGAENIYGIDNYSLTVNGTLVIEKREVELSVIPFEKEGGYYYGDGESLVYATGIGNFEGTPDLAYGQQLEVAISWLWNGESIAAPKNAGVYSYGLDGLNSKIYGEDGNLKEGGVNNYSFTCDELSLVINKFGFSVNLGEDNESCYGDELEDKAGEFYPAEFAGGALPYNEKLEIAFEYTTSSENPEVVTPKDAGEYLMRYLKYRAINSDGTVSDADNYVMVEDKGGKLIITQREITVTAQSLPNVIYGFEVTYPVEVGNHGDIGGKGLPADEYLTITSVVYYDKDGNLLEGAPLEAGTYYILPASVEIHSANGGKIDIDKNYIVSYPALPDDLTSLGTVTVLPVKLLLETNTHTDWIYSGAYQYDTGYTLWYLDEDGNKLEQFILPEEEAALVVVGTYTKVKDVCQNVENVVEYDFSATNYSIAGYEYGLLTVSERTITVITPEFETVYDGNSHTPDDYEIINKIEGHAYSLKFTTAKDVIVTDNVIVINDILDEDGYSVFDNYAIEYDYGTIAVKPRPITLQSASDDSFIYDGEEHFNANYEQLMEEGAYSLVAGHRISVTDYTKVRTVMQGAVDNVLTYKIKDTNDGNRDVTGNYKITPINGTLKVNPAHITLALNSYYGLIYGETVYPDELNNYDLSNSTALAGDDELKVAVKFYDKADEEKTLLNTIRNAGAYGVVLNVDGCFVQTSYGTENGFGNYVVDNADTAEAEVTVLPKQITVNLLNLNKVYGEEFEGYPANVGNYETDDALAYDDTLQVAVSYPDGDIDEYTTVGSFAITVDYVSVNGVSYGIGDTADFIDAGNYKITFINGTVTVAPRPVTIATGSAEKVYDGKYLYSPEATEGYKVKVYYKNSLGGVPDGIVAWDNVEDVLQFVSSSVKKIINAETIDNEVEYSLLSSNYELAVDGYFYGSLTVNKRPVNVVLSDIENQTYGTPLTYPDGSTGANFGYAEDTEYKLVEGESLILKVKFKNADGEYVEAKAVGVYTYEPDLENSVLTGSIGGAGADNYIVTSNDEKSAEIEKLYVKIALDEWATAVYNGDAHEYEGAVNIVEGGKDGKFAYGETFNLAVNYYSLTDGAQTLMTGLPENAGDYVVKYDALNSTIDGYAPDKNYLLEGPEDIFFTISPKNITVSMGAESHTYDGTVYDYPTANHNFKVSGVVTGETIVPSVSYYADEALGVPATPKTVNTYYVGYDAFTVEGGNGRAENYNLLTDADGLKCRLDIVKRDVSVSVTLGADSIELGDELPEIGFESASLGAFGFVNEDLASITPVYTYYIKDGGSYTEVSAETVNKNIGEYKIEVSFAENGVLGNYDITERVEAYLEVTARKVVIAPCAYADVVYNGQPIPTDGFTYEHFHKGYEPEAGFAEGDEPSYRLQFTPEKGVPSYDAPVNAGKYTVKFVFEGIDESRYMVYNEETVSFNILPKPVSVTLSGYDKSKLDGLLTYNYSELPEDLVTASTADIIAGEASTVEWYYDNADYGEVRYNYAGDYTVNARVVTAAGNTDYNYTVTSIDEVTFTVKKSDIYVTPIGEREDYTYEGQTLSLTRFKIWEEYGVLYGDDTLSVTGSGVLKTTRMLPVTIKKVTIMQSGRDVTGCYAVHCRYEEGSPVAEENFRAILQFNPVKIYYEQAVLDDAHRYFEYTGRPHDLGVDKNNLQNYVTVRNPQDFVGSYRLQYVLATVNAVREYEKWIQILVFDGNGNNVTSLYDLTLLNAEASKIVVHGDDFGITGLTDAEIKTAWENKDGAGSLLSESQYGNGYYVLDSGAYGSTGLKVGHECEVLVREVNGALEAKVIIFTQTANGRVESCMTYSLNPAAGLTITLSYIGQLRAPTTN